MITPSYFFISTIDTSNDLLVLSSTDAENMVKWLLQSVRNPKHSLLGHAIFGYAAMALKYKY